MTGARAVIAAVVLLLGVTACSGDDPEPKVAPTPSSSGPSDPSTSPVAGSLSPEETVRAWVEAQNLALQTGDTSQLHALSASACRGCDDFAEGIESVYDAGGSFDTAGWKVLAVNVRPGSSNPAIVDVGVSIAGGRTVSAVGEEPVVYGEEKRIMLFKIVSEGDTEAVGFVGFVE